jgi:hypothetical protein
MGKVILNIFLDKLPTCSGLTHDGGECIISTINDAILSVPLTWCLTNLHSHNEQNAMCDDQQPESDSIMLKDGVVAEKELRIEYITRTSWSLQRKLFMEEDLLHTFSKMIPSFNRLKCTGLTYDISAQRGARGVAALADVISRCLWESKVCWNSCWIGYSLALVIISMKCKFWNHNKAHSSSECNTHDKAISKYDHISTLKQIF